MIEHRLAPEFRVSGRTLSGRAMLYGDVSPSFRERFEPRAFGEVSRTDINLQHDPAIVLARDALLTDSPRELRVRAELPPGSAAFDLVRRGSLNGFSIEFFTREQRYEAGVRVVSRADLTGQIALVDRGAYPASTAEVRARSGRTLRQRIPADVALRCECAAPECKWAKIIGPAMQEAFTTAWEEATEILAVRGGYAGALASKSAGTVRARMKDGDAVVEIDIPTGPDGDAVLRAVEDTGAVIARPYLDSDRSKGTIEQRADVPEGERVMEYEHLVIRSIVIGATDARENWPIPDLIETPEDVMPRAAPAPRRRRVWL